MNKPSTRAETGPANLARRTSRVTVTLGPDWGWTRHAIGSSTVSIKGYLFDGERTLEREEAALHAVHILEHTVNDDELKTAFAKLAGHFALVIEADRRTLAVVDRIRSTPLLYAISGESVLIDDRGWRLKNQLELRTEDLADDQVLAAAMSGYTVGAGTLYKPIRGLRAGEALIAEAGGYRTLRWFTYDAWRVEHVSAPEKVLSELHRFLIERLIKSAAGRTICVPLSAGYDSRFVAAGLKAAGAKHVHLFSYGRPGNHEAEAARAIADKLGYPWRFVPFTTASQREMFEDARHERALWRDAECLTAVPFEQDWNAVVALQHDGYIPPDAIIVNGNSGDYITGQHAPAALMEDRRCSPAENEERLSTAILKKHYRLWDALATPANDVRVASLLLAEAYEAGANFEDGERLYGVHEYLECQDRQSKYVVSGQRTYEALNVSWRLPLWDDEYVLFWRRAAPSLKLGQNLYRRVLERDDWGGAFSSVPVNKKTITPAWIRPIRFAAKAACAPFGTARWRRVERQYFQWWMDPLRGTAVVPYARAMRDTRGARHGVSWLTERWLAGHKVDLSAAPEVRIMA